MRARIKDIAKKLNISESTVSRALSNHPRISYLTKKKVNATAKELNYRPNLVAKSLKLQSTKTIGLIIGDITNPFYPEVVKGVEDVANKSGFNVILCNSDYDHEKEYHYLNILIGKRVDAIILTDVGNMAASVKLLNENKVPFVLIDVKPTSKMKVNCIYSDQEYGAYIATKHLIELGHSRIALINGPKTHSPCKQLEKGFRKAMIASKIDIQRKYIKQCDLKINGGNQSMKELLMLKKDELPTAILFISDITAIGACDAIHDEGLKIPDDFSIIGYDDIPEAKYFSPPLSTVAQPKYELGSQGMSLLINEIFHSQNNEFHQVRLLPELIIRESTTYRKRDS